MTAPATRGLPDYLYAAVDRLADALDPSLSDPAGVGVAADELGVALDLAALDLGTSRVCVVRTLLAEWNEAHA